MDSTPGAQRDEPDHTEDPRQQDTGQGLPESAPEGASPREGTEDGPAPGTEDGPAPGTGGEDAPSPATAKEGDRDASTGNPDAAG